MGVRRFTAAEQKAKRRKLNHDYHIKHPQRTRWHQLKRFGWTLDLYMAVYRAQHGLCAICGKPGPYDEFYKRLRPDHDHGTGKPRGLLCNNCNVAAGLLCDDPHLADALARYLRGYQQ